MSPEGRLDGSGAEAEPPATWIPKGTLAIRVSRGRRSVWAAQPASNPKMAKVVRCPGGAIVAERRSTIRMICNGIVNALNTMGGHEDEYGHGHGRPGTGRTGC
jgi:hypothetical protein